MRRILILIFFVSGTFYINSCKDDFNLEAEFRPRQVFNCIIRPDTVLQVVSLSTSYRADGLNPNEMTESPAIIGADVKMWYRNEVYQFRDTSLQRNDVSRYNEPVTVYYNNSFKPNKGGEIEMEALLPNGLLLTSLITIPDVSPISFALSDTLIPAPYQGKYVKFNWTDIGELIYDPKLVIYYYNRIDHQKYEREIPLEYFLNDGIYTPNYPVASVNNSVVYEMDAITRAMEEISEGDPVKTNYSVTEIRFKVMVFDENLSAYYSSIQDALDSYTIKLDVADYSNITGGFGIFGSYNVIEFKLKVSDDYVASFGYIVGF